MDFFELNNDELKILNEWFKDKELMKRLGGILPIVDWFEYVKQNSSYFAWMVYSKEIPVGQISLEISSDYSASISMITNPSLRNKGYGKAMLNDLLQRPELSNIEIIQVEIEQDNFASLHCFKQVGFIEEGMDEEGFISLSLKLFKKSKE